MHPIQCKCGALRGQLEGTGVHNRLICYCTDCRAFAVFLGKTDDVLDQQGGTEIVQVAQPRVRLLQGEDRLAAVRLSENGMLRWYASCCNTPIGNTVGEPQISFMGVIHACLDPAAMDKDFGTAIALLNTDTALGEPKPKQRGLMKVLVRFLWIVLAMRITGRYKKTQLFNASGSPRAVPLVLTPQALAQLKRAK